jgi:hypothetical protein
MIRYLVLVSRGQGQCWERGAGKLCVWGGGRALVPSEHCTRQGGV